MFELIIFDCDGVLIDSELDGCQMEATMLNQAGINISTQDVIKRFTGMPAKKMYQILEEENNVKLPFDFHNIVTKKTLELFEKQLKPIKGVKEFLEKNDAPVCVASGSNPERLEKTLKKTELYDFFAPNIFSTSLVQNGKPAPDIFYYCAEKMLIPPVRCLVIEDSASGIIGAKKAGMNVLGFIGGSHCLPNHSEILQKAGADNIFSDMKDLAQIIADWS